MLSAYTAKAFSVWPQIDLKTTGRNTEVVSVLCWNMEQNKNIGLWMFGGLNNEVVLTLGGSYVMFYYSKSDLKAIFISISVNYWYDMEFDIKYNYYKCIESLVDIVKWDFRKH